MAYVKLRKVNPELVKVYLVSEIGYVSKGAVNELITQRKMTGQYNSDWATDKEITHAIVDLAMKDLFHEN